jgi:hypothetical protein
MVAERTRPKTQAKTRAEPSAQGQQSQARADKPRERKDDQEKPSAGAGLTTADAFQKQIEEAVQPIIGELKSQLVESVRQQVEQSRKAAPAGSDTPGEHEPEKLPAQQAAEGSSSALRESIGRAVEAARSFLRAILDLIRRALGTLKRALTAPARPVGRALKSFGQGGLKERMAGAFMQWEGKVTGDPIRKTEGKALSGLGRLKGRKAGAAALTAGVVVASIAIAAQRSKHAEEEP